MIEVKVSSHVDGEKEADSVIHTYMLMTSGSFDNEHDAYELAKGQLISNNQDKFNKVIKLLQSMYPSLVCVIPLSVFEPYCEVYSYTHGMYM